MKNNRKWKTTAFILTCGLTVALEGGAAAQTSAGSGLNAGEIRTTMILALAFMEALTIYGLLVAILLVNKL